MPNPDPVTDRRPCPLCAEDVESLPIDDVPLEIWTLYPMDAFDTVPNARTFRAGGRALLHHACPSPQADTDTAYWDFERAWWACADPARPLDGGAHFDLNCMGCARRWSAEGQNLT